jgi:multicomponent Na+:H+ antiporter subunit E
VTILLYVGAIVLVWVFAWGSLTFANVLGGLAVAIVVLAWAPDGLGRSGRRPAIRPIAIGRLLMFVLVELLRSNVALTRMVLAPRPKLHAGVLEVPLPSCSDGLLTLIANVLALTPGTNPLHVDRDPTVLYVHVLQMYDAEQTRADVLRLADLAFRAFSPNPLAVERMVEAKT